MLSLVNRSLKIPQIIGLLSRANSKSNRVDVNQKRLKLFGDDISPPVRFVKMTALELKVPLEFIEIDLFKRENMSQTYTAINPLQKVPALAVGKDIMVDSHSIAMYLCDAFDKKDVLYSKDPVKRSKINEMLFYNSCYLFPIDSNMFCEFFESGKPVSDQKRESWYKALDYLNNKLEYSPYLAGGDRYSLADLCCMATITSTQLIVPPNQRHTKLHDWMEKMLSSPCFEVNLVGLEKLYCHVQKIQPKPINH